MKNYYLLGVLFFVLTACGSISNLPANPTNTAPNPYIDGVGGNDTFPTAIPTPTAVSTTVKTELSPVFTPEVQFWANDIIRWSNENDIEDPNLVAILMQFASCGYQDLEDSSGRYGLFRVHSTQFEGEDKSKMLDPNNNALIGLTYFAHLLEQSTDVGIAFAGYHGGPVLMITSWDRWPEITRFYYHNVVGVYQDVYNDLPNSDTLQRWLELGGSELCQLAAIRQNQTPN